MVVIFITINIFIFNFICNSKNNKKTTKCSGKFLRREMGEIIDISNIKQSSLGLMLITKSCNQKNSHPRFPITSFG